VSPVRPFLLPQPPVYPQPVDVCRPWSQRRAFVFITIQMPLPVTPLSARPYKTWGCHLCLVASAPCPALQGHEPQVPHFHGIAASCTLFALFSALPCFVFNSLRTLFPKYLGVGYPQKSPLLESTTSRLFFSTCLQPSYSPLRRGLRSAPATRLGRRASVANPQPRHHADTAVTMGSHGGTATLGEKCAPA
jgi:hypothetical protein